MVRPRFNETLGILPPATQSDRLQLQAAGLNPDLPLSVCAMGPVEPGETIQSMRVWVFQETDTKAAASSGKGGQHLGGHDPVGSETFPNKGPDWMIQTQLEEGSEQFTPEAPALAVAMAVVERVQTNEAGTQVAIREIKHWSQGILIGEQEGEEEHPHP
jgi:hypothetical protein